jgi:hypothetical protein
MLIRPEMTTEDEMDFLVPPKRRGRPTSMAELAADAVGRVARKGKLKLPRVSERSIQIAIKNHLIFYGIVCVHVPNAGKRSVVGGRIAKAEGLFPGFPDLVVLGKGGRVGFMEVKAADGSLQQSQRDCIAMLERMGQLVTVVRSSAEAMDAVKAWGWVNASR